MLGEEVKLDEGREERNHAGDFLRQTELAEIIHALKKNLAFVGDQSRVERACSDLAELVEDQVVLDKSWLVLMNVILQQVAILVQRLEGQLNVRVDTHPAPPDEHLVLI